MNRRQALLTAGAALAAPALAGLGRASFITPLDLGGGQVFLQGGLDGHIVEMMLDSGSAPTLVDVALARSLGLPLSEGGAAIGTAGGAMPALRTGGFRLAVGFASVTFPPDSALALDLSSLAPGRSLGVIAGQALLEGTRLDLDLPRSVLLTGEISRTKDQAGLRLTTEADGLRAVPIGIDGRADITATFDLGAAIPLQVTRAWADANGLLAGRRQSSWVVTGIDGPSVYTTAVLPRLNLGGFVLRNVPIGVIETQPEGSSPAVIGLPIWRRFRLVTDYAADTLWIAPGKGQLKTPFNRDRSGLAVRVEGDVLVVVHVARASPAEAGGWREGERIVAVNGRPIDQNRPSRWARQRARTRVHLQLADGSQRNLVLADYY